MSSKCPVCNKTVYPMDPQIALDGHKYHKGCAKCSDCGCQISLSNFTKCDTALLCKTHYFKRFHEEGSYVGGDKYENKNPRDSKSGGSCIPAPTPHVARPVSTPVTASTTSSSVNVSKLASSMNDANKTPAADTTVKPSSIAGRKKVFSMPVGSS